MKPAVPPHKREHYPVNSAGKVNLMETNEYDYLTINKDKYGNGYNVYGWGTYPEESVLAGQALKQYLDGGFESVEAAQEAFPGARLSHPLLEPQVSLDHLPDGPDEGVDEDGISI